MNRVSILWSYTGRNTDQDIFSYTRVSAFDLCHLSPSTMSLKKGRWPSWNFIWSRSKYAHFHYDTMGESPKAMSIRNQIYQYIETGSSYIYPNTTFKQPTGFVFRKAESLKSRFRRSSTASFIISDEQIAQISDRIFFCLAFLWTTAWVLCQGCELWRNGCSKS